MYQNKKGCWYCIVPKGGYITELDNSVVHIYTKIVQGWSLVTCRLRRVGIDTIGILGVYQNEKGRQYPLVTKLGGNWCHNYQGKGRVRVGVGM